MAPARLFLGLLLAIVGVTIAVVGVPATTVLAVSALGVVLLAPPWRWLFGAGLATMAVGAAASGFGAEQASGALVVASAIALAFSVLLAAAQAATGWRRVVPLAVRRTSMTGTLPDMPLLELSRSAGSAIRSLTPFAPGGRTELVTTDKRLSSLAKVVETLDVETILDVGCEGGTPMHLARNRLYGLHRFDVCPDNAYMATWYRSAEASRGIPYDDSTFDCVILGDVIEHVPDPDSLLADVRRVLRPGGLLVVSTPNVVFWANRMLVPLGVHRRFTETSTDTNIGRARFTTFSHKSLDRLLQQTGYEVLRRKGAPSLFRFPLSLADRALSHFPSVASRLLYVARRDDD